MGGSQQGSQSGSGRNFADDTLRPITIKQLIDSKPPYPDSDVTIDGLPAKQVTLVGQVRSVANQSINTTYRIDDGTGLIDARKWVDPDKPESSVQFAPDTYVRVFGRLTTFNGKQHIAAHYVRAIQDFNEVNYHLLEATYVHLMLTKGASAGGTDADGDSMFVDGGYGAGGGSGAAASDARLASCSADARTVFNFMANSPGHDTNISQIEAGTRMDSSTVSLAVQGLLDAGVIYTTDDDFTWAILDI
ncbi:uncharacterized protein B0H64DRAFT_194947 [Chaetomium fimeti]|uniref:Replication protein A C-terminal domain-containing protein n=1 Tax=Chaetomium fimeti TaxID=1854472 RepID=A0AAE0HE42_9PEZI|nr:hypothetical protein B0H64DRAFT_194947 [Chaetomium fimeti]